MIKQLIFTAVLALCMFSGFGQSIGYSVDSLVRYEVYEDSANNSRFHHSDSIVVVFNGEKLTISSYDKEQLAMSDCDTLIDNLWSKCQLFRLPRIVSCIKLEDDMYVMMGYSSDYPLYCKHIWILNTEKEINVSHRYGMICSRSSNAGIEFSYNIDSQLIIFNNIDNHLIDKHIYRIDGFDLHQDDISFTQWKNMDYSIYRSSPKQPLLHVEDRIQVEIRLFK